MVTKDMTVKQLKEKRIRKIDFNINDILLIIKIFLSSIDNLDLLILYKIKKQFISS